MDEYTSYLLLGRTTCSSPGVSSLFPQCVLCVGFVRLATVQVSWKHSVFELPQHIGEIESRRILGGASWPFRRSTSDAPWSHCIAPPWAINEVHQMGVSQQISKVQKKTTESTQLCTTTDEGLHSAWVISENIAPGAWSFFRLFCQP
jgi:hypothetical protein